MNIPKIHFYYFMIWQNVPLTFDEMPSHTSLFLKEFVRENRFQISISKYRLISAHNFVNTRPELQTVINEPIYNIKSYCIS